MAKITGKEAAVFLTSGTLSNQIALRTHLRQPPYSVLCDHRAHVYKCVVDVIIDDGGLQTDKLTYRYEAGGAAFHSGATVIAVPPSNGKLDG